MAELGNPHPEAEDPLSNFNSTLSGTYCAPFIVLDWERETRRSPSLQGTPVPEDCLCLWSKEKLRGQEKGRQSAPGVLVGGAADSAWGPQGRPRGGSDSENGLGERWAGFMTWGSGKKKGRDGSTERAKQNAA